MSNSGGSVSDAPVDKTVDGQPHQLAYITPEETQSLVDQGGQPTMTDEGVMAYPPGMGDPAYASSDNAASNQGGKDGGNQDSDETSWTAADHTPPGWSGDAGVDAWESDQGVPGDLGGVGDYQGTIFEGGTHAKGDKPGQITINYGNDAITQDVGRPTITYNLAGDSWKSKHNSKAQISQIKYIQDAKLNTVISKLNKAGFEIDKDANFDQVKAFINDLDNDDLPDSYKDLKDKHGKPLYSQETITKWEAEKYLPQSMRKMLPTIGGIAMDAFLGGKQLTRDELWEDLDLATAVGDSADMSWMDRMKTYSPNQYAIQTGQTYNPHSKTFSPKEGRGQMNAAQEQAAASRVTSSYQTSGNAPQASQAAKWFANLGGSTGGFNLQQAYATAKTKQAGILGNPSAIGQLAVNQSPFYDWLKKNNLNKGIL